MLLRLDIPSNEIFKDSFYWESNEAVSKGLKKHSRAMKKSLRCIAKEARKEIMEVIKISSFS